MGVLLITDNIETKRSMEESLLKNSFTDFHSITLEHDLLLWQAKLKCDIIILLISTVEYDQYQKFISSLDRDIRVLLLNHNKFPDKKNIYSLSQQNYNAEIISFLQKCQQEDARNEKEDLLIRINDKYKRIRTAEIEYLQADGKYITLHLEDRSYSLRSSLKSMESVLPDFFLRTHASYIVNTNKIESIHMHEQNIDLNNVSIPFSRKYKSTILNRFYLG